MNDFGGYGGYGGAQFEFDPVALQTLGFTQEEIGMLQYVVMNEGKVSTNTLVNYYGLSYEVARKLRYMYDICTGKVNIQTEEDLCKHLRKMFGAHQRIGIQNLALSRISEVPRTAVIAGIPENTPFGIWNSKRYKGNDMMYHVIDVSGSNIIIETSRIPQIRHGQAKKIENMLEIREGPKNGKILVAVNKNYCRLCNRFVIVGSLRRPEFHHGMVEIICIEGSKVYVFADTMAAKKYSRYGNNTQRVYDYGFFASEIPSKLMACASVLFGQLHGYSANKVPANAQFNLVPIEVEETEDELIVE